MTTNKGAEKPKGRPSKFKPEFVEQARKLAILGATDREVADFFEVDERTVYRWKHENEAFCQSLRVGKSEADARVEQALYRRAIGYSHDAVKIAVNAQGAVTQVPYTEHTPPDTTAAIFWLKNRKPGEWRDVRTIEGTVNHQLAGLTDDELATIALGGGEGIADAKGRAH